MDPNSPFICSDRISPGSLGWLGTCYVDKASLKLCLPLPPKSAGFEGVHRHAWHTHNALAWCVKQEPGPTSGRKKGSL